MQKTLHIVSFNVPYPADYGGVVDVYHRLRSLAALGVRLQLHCYTYGRPPAKELEQYCDSVLYYQRGTSPLRLLDREPYIVSSRRNKQLLNDLRKDEQPILLEGLHCCALLDGVDPERCYVRAHNVEHEYYARLADAEQKMLRRIYLRSDARKLKRYEPQLLKAKGIFAVTEADAAHFRSMGCRNVWLMPSSHNNDEIRAQVGCGSYTLYHADLSVPENIQAAIYLMDNIFNNSPHRLIIAGRHPDERVRSRADQMDNVELVDTPSDDEMKRLMTEAQVHILVTNQPTGLKLKLLNSLYAGRHILVNSQMVAGTALGAVCTVADTAEAQRDALDRLMLLPFSENDIAQRKKLIGELYSNEANAKVLVQNIFGE